MSLAEKVVGFPFGRLRGSNRRKLTLNVLGQTLDEHGSVFSGQLGYGGTQAWSTDEFDLAFCGVKKRSHKAKEVQPDDGFIVTQEPFDELGDELSVPGEMASHRCGKSKQLKLR